MQPVDSPISLETFQNAVQQWCQDATNIKTIWRNQSAPLPDYPFASLMVISGPTPVSSHWETRTTFDEERLLREIEYNTCVPCTFVISVQFYIALQDSRNPGYAATQYAARAQSALRMPSYIDHFRSNSIAVNNTGTVQNIDQLIHDAYVSRANIDVTFGAPLNAYEYVTYIEQVEISNTDDSEVEIDTTVSL